MGLFERMAAVHGLNPGGDVATAPDMNRDKTLDGAVADRSGDRIPKSSEKTSHMSHARASVKRHFPPLSSNKEYFPFSYARASDKRDTFSVMFSGPIPGDCAICRAAAEWPWKGRGKFCFGNTVFFGKTQKAVSIDLAWHNCPLDQSKKTK